MHKIEKDKFGSETFQIFLSNLLKEEDNKYCVDCDGKGPRWTSWNLGIFLCIRCAGIHRNLGVHVSKVKSVNLDSWNMAQLAMMKEIGNTRARAIYEANLPDNFRRPQSDAMLEQFIRRKYEQKLYIAKEWIPVTPSGDTIIEDLRRIEQSQAKKRMGVCSTQLKNKSITLPPPPSSALQLSSKSTASLPTTKSKNEPKPNLLDFEDDLFEDKKTLKQTSAINEQDNSFGEFMSFDEKASDTETKCQQNDTTKEAASSSLDLLCVNLGGMATSETSVPNSEVKKENVRDSILALYGNQPNPIASPGQWNTQPRETFAKQYNPFLSSTASPHGYSAMPPNTYQASNHEYLSEVMQKMSGLSKANNTIAVSSCSQPTRLEKNMTSLSNWR